MLKVAFDGFPAKVSLPSGAELGMMRAVLIEGRLDVFRLNNGKPELYFSRDVVSVDGKAFRSGINFQVEDGVVRVVKEKSCGCGNPLKNAKLYPGEKLVRVPL